MALNNVTKVKYKGMSPFPTALVPKEPDPIREKIVEHSRVVWKLGVRFPSLPKPS